MNHKDHKDHKEDKEDQKAKNVDDRAARNGREAYRPLPADTERIIREIIGAGIAVHRALGPGFLEPAYERALAIELRLRNLRVETQKIVLIQYRGEVVCRHRIDLIVEGVVIVEVKAVRRLRRLHQAQILSYQKATGCRAGLLMNFNVRTFIEGLQRFIR